MVEAVGDAFFHAGFFGGVEGEGIFEVVLAGDVFGEIVAVEVVFAVTGGFSGGAVGIAEEEGDALDGFGFDFAFRGSEGGGGGIAFGGGRHVDRGVGEGEFAFGEADEIAGLVGGDGEREGEGIGEADVFGGEDDEAAGEETGVFSAGEHFCQPIEGGVGVGAAHAFDEGGNGVVVFVFVGVVADLAFGGESAEVVGGDFGVFREAGNDDFEGVEGAAEIAVAEAGEIGEDFGSGGGAGFSETAFGVGEGAGEGGGDFFEGERFEAEEVAAADERGDDVEAGVVGGGADEADVAFFDVGEEEVLLGFVEAVDFVDEEDGFEVGAGAGGLEDLAEFGDVGLDGVDADEMGVGFAGDDFGETGFAAAGRTVKKEAAEFSGLDQFSEQAAVVEEVALADDFVEALRTHPGGERPVGGGGRRFGARGRRIGGGVAGEEIELVAGAQLRRGRSRCIGNLPRRFRFRSWNLRGLRRRCRGRSRASRFRPGVSRGSFRKRLPCARVGRCRSCSCRGT